MASPTDGPPTAPKNPQAFERVPAELSTPTAWLDPFEWYAEMRETAPVRYDDDRGCWDVFRYADASTVLKDSATFSSNPALARDVDLPPPEERGPIFDTVLTTDGARHDRLRGVVEEAFQPRSLAAWEPRIEAVATELVSEAVRGGEMELIEDFAYPLPVVVIAELLGVPSEDQPRFKRWSDTLVETPTERSEAAIEQFRERREAALDELEAYLEGILSDRRESPRDDLISEIVHAEASGQTLTHDEQLGFCMLLLVAGNITTTNLIGNAMRCLTAHPDAMARIESDHTLRPTMLEEVLRYRSPVQALSRVATRDTTLAGTEIAEGDVVIVWLGSANRDPAVFDAPEAFRIDRAPNPHLGFGRGTHYCLGAPLARLEARIGFDALFGAMTDIERTTADLDPVRSAFIYGVRSFPIRFRQRPSPEYPADTS